MLLPHVGEGAEEKEAWAGAGRGRVGGAGRRRGRGRRAGREAVGVSGEENGRRRRRGRRGVRLGRQWGRQAAAGVAWRGLARQANQKQAMHLCACCALCGDEGGRINLKQEK